MPVRSDKAYLEIPATRAVTVLSSEWERATIAWRISWLLFALAAYRFWIAPLPSSLWLDETGTFWAIRNGPGPMLGYIREWPTVTAVYGLVESAAYALGGAREYVLRLPSLIAIGLATLLVYRLVRKLCGESSALPAIAVFACAPPVAFAGADARAYALLLLVVAGSTLALVRWLESGSKSDAVIYVITAALAPHLHYLACPVLAVHAVYVVARYREGTPVRIGALFAAGVAVLALVAPLAPSYLRIAHARRALSFSLPPTILDLSNMLAPPVLLSGVIVGLAVAWMVSGRQPGMAAANSIAPPVRTSTIVLMAALAAGPVFLAFAISTLTSARIFVPRYVIASQVGVALLAGWMISRLRSSLTRAIVTISILLFSLAALRVPGQARPVYPVENWKDAMARVRQIAGQTQMPVFIQTGLIEATTLGLDFNAKPPSFMLAPLAAYPAAGRVILMPPLNSEPGLHFLQTNLTPTVQGVDRFLVVTRDDHISPTLIRATLPAYKARAMGDFGTIDLLLFTRQ